jgi:hypothetical protein
LAAVVGAFAATTTLPFGIAETPKRRHGQRIAAKVITATWYWPIAHCSTPEP